MNYPRTISLLVWCALLTGQTVSAGPEPDTGFDERATQALAAATSNLDTVDGSKPMHYWIAQSLFERSESEKALGIVRRGMKLMRSSIEKRESLQSENIGANGFLYWGALNCYVHWHSQFDQPLLDDYRYVFTHAHNYKGTTSNLGMIHTLALLLADHIWGPENLPKNGKYGARGANAVKWLTERVERIARKGSGEFASRPYMLYNVGTLLTLTNDFVDESLRKKAAMAYEMSIAHDAATWLHGHWAIPSGRSYPDQLTQQPNGSASMLWTYFGGVPPKLDDSSSAIFTAAEKFRPSPLIVKAATDRSQPFVCRSRFDGDQQFQTSFSNRTYAVFSTAVTTGGVWGQTYPYGVMWDESDPSKNSHLWLTVPSSDGAPLAFSTHGINSKLVQFAQHRGSMLLVASHLDAKKEKFPYALGFVPGGWQAMTNDSASTGRIFLHYGSVLIAISATQPFQWDPRSGISAGSKNPQNSEFRIYGDKLAIGLETALPSDFTASSPEGTLAAFREAVLAKSTVALCATAPGPDTTAQFTDHDSNTIKRTFNGDTVVNGERIAYESWPLLENPWMRQEWGGNLTISDGKTTRVYDVTNWSITETQQP